MTATLDQLDAMGHHEHPFAWDHMDEGIKERERARYSALLAAAERAKPRWNAHELAALQEQGMMLSKHEQNIVNEARK